jgi:hypothetical protein
LQKSKGDTIFFKYWKNIKYRFKNQKATEWYNKVIAGPNFLSDRYNNNIFLFRKIISFTFSGFSIIFIGYILINILITPPREIGISP